jgi:hypothetical protein
MRGVTVQESPACYLFLTNPLSCIPPLPALDARRIPLCLVLEFVRVEAHAEGAVFFNSGKTIALSCLASRNESLFECRRASHERLNTHGS